MTTSDSSSSNRGNMPNCVSTVSGVYNLVSCSSPFQLLAGNAVTLGTLKLQYLTDGNLTLYRNFGLPQQRTLWSSLTPSRNCTVGCIAALKSDGNLVLSQNGSDYWASNSSGQADSVLHLSSRPPYLSVRSNGKIRWSADQNLNWFGALDPMTGVAGYGATRPGVSDFMALFQLDSASLGAFNQVNVVQLYMQTLLPWFTTDADLQTIFSFLKQNNMALAVEFPPIMTSSTCLFEGGFTDDYRSLIANRIKNLGGDLAYIAMDEPMDFYFHYKAQDLGTPLTSCPFNNPTELAQLAAQTYSKFQEVFPAVQLGEIENDIQSHLAEYQIWLSALQGAIGGKLAFFHDDALVEQASWKTGTPNLQTFLQSNAIPYGIIWNGNGDATADLEWMSIAEARVQTYRTTVGVLEPSQNVFQSWHTYPTKLLPETNTSRLSFLINYLFPAQLQIVPEPNPIQIYRFTKVSGDYLFSTVQSEAGFTLEGPAFTLFGQSGGTRVPLYSCYVQGSGDTDHFLSLDINCEGQQKRGLLGYVDSVMNFNASAPLYLCYDNLHHFETLNGLECKQKTGYSIVGVFGYVSR